MITTVNAVYEDGVFRPEEPVSLPEKAKVRLVIESVEPTTADADDPTGWKAIDPFSVFGMEPTRPRLSHARSTAW